MESLIRLKDIFVSLSVGRKFMVLILAGAVSGAVYALSLPLRGLDQSPLYAKLSPADAAQVVEKLRNDSIPFRLTNGGRTVTVPSKMVDELRIKLSQDGLPKNEGEGLEILDKSPLGMSDFSQKVGYQRAIQGELARTISSLENVQSARVHLVFPEESPFLDSQDGARASVMLTLRPGAGIDQKQLSGIVHLVSGAVKELKAENVSVLDSQGRLLAGGRSKDGVYSQGNELLELQRDAERYLEEKATSLLDGFLGAGKAIVRTRVEMDDRVVREKTETYDPNGPIRSEQQNGAKAGPSFVKNYEVGHSVKEIVLSPGAIRRLYVSVAVDGTSKEDPNTPGVRTYVARTEEEMNSIATLVKETVGFSEDREDKFEIKNVAFDTAQRDKMMAEAAAQDEILKKERTRRELLHLAARGGSALGIVFVIFLFTKFLKAAGAESAAAAPTTELAVAPAAAPPAAVAPSAPPPGAGAEGGAAVNALPATNSAEAQAALLAAARKDPAGVARMMQKKFSGRPA